MQAAVPQSVLPLFKREREREAGNMARGRGFIIIIIIIIIIIRVKTQFAVLKVPKQCPLVLLVKAG
jgi:hypothetical protein